MLIDAAREPVGFPSLQALLAYAGRQGWATYQVGNYAPQLALMSLEGFNMRFGTRQGRLWVHTSVIPATSPMLAVFLPGLWNTSRAGPAVAPDEARHQGLTLIQIVREPSMQLADNALITEVTLPKLDASSKDAAYIAIKIGTTILKRWPP